MSHQSTGAASEAEKMKNLTILGALLKDIERGMDDLEYKILTDKMALRQIHSDIKATEKTAKEIEKSSSEMAISSIDTLKNLKTMFRDKTSFERKLCAQFEPLITRKPK
uniref:SKA2 domain-containing protein n=1 Tax=Parastrongyloides trichosuri TaxID=131310 RepID=A0A0N5A060_PARTI